ncbi:RNA-processing protein [Candidatus Woesearchaeota archaeon]|nr:RNA-processing protein [Candidatus Woesearchaeota archaeon]
MEFIHEVKIPKDRVAVLIGTKGKIKKELEDATNSKLYIDSKEGDIQIKGDDGIKLYICQEIVKAIGRGFNPETAMLLLKQDYIFEIVNLADYSDKKNQLMRVKGRVIGTEGKSRKTIETLTGAQICVYGKTIGLIGQAEEVTSARRAIESLVAGSPHATVYRWLEKQLKKHRVAPSKDDFKQIDD